jgi:hypothetical protein
MRSTRRSSGQTPLAALFETWALAVQVDDG